MMSQTERNARRQDARKTERREAEPPTCPYCQRAAVFMQDSSSLYATGKDWGPMWACLNPAHERAWVGCHPRTTKPLGRLADKALRQAKLRAHAAFDPLWKTKMERDALGQNEARRAGYAWLAKQLGINPADCHVGMFDVATCDRVVALCEPYARKLVGANPGERNA